MLTLLLSLLALVRIAAAGDPQLVYDLMLDGKAIGQRQVSLRYMPTANGEIRILETTTKIGLNLAGQSYRFEQRATAKAGGTPGFTSAVDDNGAIREIQGRLLPDRRWLVTVAEAGNVETYYLRGSEVNLSSLDLLDPERHQLLSREAAASVLVAETGAVMSGKVEDLGETAVRVGGEEVLAHRYAWTPETGRVELVWSLDGTLLSYQTRVLGKLVTATLEKMPPPPTFGTVDSPMGGASTTTEEKL